LLDDFARRYDVMDHPDRLARDHGCNIKISGSVAIAAPGPSKFAS
jgi:hypothetical protein